MSHHHFSEIYKTWSDLELFRLLQNKGDYQQEAIEAAEAEINARKLSETKLETLEKIYEGEQFKKQNTREKKLARAIEAKKEKLIEDLNPLSEKTANRHIRLICYGLALIIIYSFTSDYRWVRGLITARYFDISILLLSMPYFFVPIGIYYFWKKQKFGWSIIAIWLVLSVVIAITSYISELRRTGDPFWDRFMPKLGLTHYLLSVLIFGGLLFYINTSKVKEPFNVDKKLQLQTGAIAVLYTFLNLVIITF